jgi:hypothetical protein
MGADRLDAEGLIDALGGGEGRRRKQPAGDE